MDGELSHRHRVKEFWRVSEILKWVEDGDYARLINGAAESAAA